MTRIQDAPPPTEQFGARRLVPRIDTLTAARRHWFLVALVTLLFTAAGAAAGILRQPAYQAETRLTVGRIDISNPAALGSFTTATAALASQYSRTIDADGVTRRVARSTGLPPALVAARVEATPIPQSPVIRVRASGTTSGGATRLANRSGDALIAYTTELNRSNPDTPRLLSRFRAASSDLERDRSRLNDARRRHDAAPSDRTRGRVQQARVDVEVTKLRAQTLRKAYESSLQSQALTSLVQVLTPATGASSDRLRKLQLYGFIGFIAGLAVGLALANLRANALIRRRFAA